MLTPEITRAVILSQYIFQSKLDGMTVGVAGDPGGLIKKVGAGVGVGVGVGGTGIIMERDVGVTSRVGVVGGSTRVGLGVRDVSSARNSIALTGCALEKDTAIAIANIPTVSLLFIFFYY